MEWRASRVRDCNSNRHRNGLHMSTRMAGFAAGDGFDTHAMGDSELPRHVPFMSACGCAANGDSCACTVTAAPFSQFIADNRAERDC